MMAGRDLRPRRGIVYGGNLAIVGATMFAVFARANIDSMHMAGLATDMAPVVAAMLATIACFLGEMQRYEKPGRVTTDLAAGVFALVYIGLFMSALIELRSLGSGPIGLWALLTLVAVVKCGDIGAYTVGRLIGRHKMAPVLSPGKTWEGAAGAIGFATLSAWLAIAWLGPLALGDSAPHAPRLFWLGYGIVVGAAGMIGDLAESLLKRDLGVKDSSRWMPGFGGVLDILDSILLPAPIAMLFWQWLLYCNS